MLYAMQIVISSSIWSGCFFSDIPTISPSFDFRKNSKQGNFLKITLCNIPILFTSSSISAPLI